MATTGSPRGAGLTANSARFDGSFGTVLVDGRVSGNGAFSGFLSAGPLTPDQVNGAGLSYWLNASQGSLGTVSGVAAFIPGSMVPLTPPLVQRNVAYAAGGLLLSDFAGGIRDEQSRRCAHGFGRKPHAIPRAVGAHVGRDIRAGRSRRM